MAEHFQAYDDSMEEIKMEDVHDGQQYHQLSFDASVYQSNLAPTWPGRREVDHFNDYIAFYYQKPPLQTDQEKISQIQQFNQLQTNIEPRWKRILFPTICN